LWSCKWTWELVSIHNKILLNNLNEILYSFKILIKIIMILNIYIFRYCKKEDYRCIFRCGKDYGNCPGGQCCSKKGYCGTNSNFCSPSLGCQSNYGKCIEMRCGEGIGKWPNGQCCSTSGYCGTSHQFCGKFLCQKEYGNCEK